MTTFFDFKSKVNNKVWQKNIQGVKVNWNNIKEEDSHRPQ